MVVKKTFKDVSHIMLYIYRGSSLSKKNWSDKDAEKFKKRVLVRCFGDKWKEFCDAYKNVMLLGLRCYATIGTVNFNVLNLYKQAEPKPPPPKPLPPAPLLPYVGSMNYISKVLPFRLNWNCDRYMDDTLDMSTVEDDPSFKNLILNSRKSKMFKWSVSSAERVWTESQLVRGEGDSTKTWPQVANDFGVSLRSRVPEYWYGGLGSLLSQIDNEIWKIDGSDIRKDSLPVCFILTLNFYADFYFKGYNHI